MARLDSCYFCGTAEDSPLREVTVTPRRRRDDPDAAVSLTLCASCEDKLERVLGGLFEHVESRRAAEDEEAEAEVAEPEAEEEPADHEPVDRIDVASTEAEEAPPTGRRELFADPPEPDPDPSGGASAAGSADEDAEILEDESRVTARATANATDALDGVSVEEYNSVMRLLQNREFPMARAAFVDLAANAYDLGEGTVEQVLDAVIGQGSLAEREGELVRPGEGGSS